MTQAETLPKVMPMLRILSALTLLVLVGCGGSRGSPRLPGPLGSPLTNMDRPSRRATDSLSGQLDLPSAPLMDSALVAADFAAEGRLAADSAAVEARLEPELPGVRITALAKATGRTGVEMEALTAVAVACLTVYDMVKAVDRGMVIEDVRLVSKSGGTRGDWRRSES
jgi:hypothetical protein